MEEKELEELIKTQQKVIKQLSSDVSLLTRKIDGLNKKMTIIDSKNDTRFWQLYSKPNESREDTTKRFFSTLPTAKGNIRIIQLYVLSIMKYIHNICEQNNIFYWVGGGCLIGVLRHGGFIPWDDDMDICMLREDFEKFKNVVQQSESDFILKTYYTYNNVIPDGLTKYIRVIHKDLGAPFVDIFLYDKVNNDSHDTLEIAKNIRKEFRIESLKYKELGLSDYEYESKFTNLQNYLKTKIANNQNLTGILWSLDNGTRYDDANVLYDKNLIFPIKKLKFENIDLYFPNNIEKLAESKYGNIWEMPSRTNVLSSSHNLNFDKNTISLMKKVIKDSNVENSAKKSIFRNFIRKIQK